MGSDNIFWTCRQCGASVSGDLTQCPACTRPIQRQKVVAAAESELPAWVRGISIPGAIFGLLTFFLPWVAVSCGPLQMTFSGYEIASGEYQNKYSEQNVGAFYDRLDRQLNLPQNRRLGATPPRNQPPPAKDAPNTPLLWIVPGACAILVLLGIFGLPRAPTIVVCVVGAACLAFLGISWEQQLNDPSIVGPLQH